ncbi:MAG: hypothetical protein M3416_18085 [Acidobacteriota bacterium]|nr:hypothetical protein [Acidobacteriota bacterium]
MRTHKAAVLLVISTLAVTTITAMAMRTKSNSFFRNQDHSPNERQQEERYNRRKERERKFPAVDYEAPEPAEPEKRAKRKLKNSRYDRFGFAIEDPSPRTGEESLESEWQLHVESIPAAQSDSIVVGEVLSGEAHLSNDKAGVYSEFTVRIIEVIKSNNPSLLAPGNLIDIDRPGGFVRYPNGHKRFYSVLGQNMPEIGRRYVLFLTASGQSPNYRLLTGYELGSDGVAPLDNSTKMDVYKGVDETTFLKTVRDAVTKSQ